MRDGKIADVGYHPPYNMLFSSSEFEYGDLVVLARSFSNSTPSALCRAISAYRRADLTRTSCKRVGRQRPKRAKRLNDTQLARLVDQYESGTTVYELASEFAIDRRTV
ncbi:MAG: hypothetical protein M0Z95_00425, partial [Actinomycetota bacterium]|nr:hypothetical protein [Actinomycetota bacterium]